MFATTDTIVAIATPPGRGAIGVVRISGPRAFEVAQQLASRRRPFEPRRATLAAIHGVAIGNEAVRSDVPDRALVTVFPKPASYTGEDVAEISAHGNPVVLQAIVRAATRLGARLAEPGEFTLRAFLNQRLDLPQAEAVADLIEASTPSQARAAFDQLQGTLTQALTRIEGELFELVARLEASVDFPEEGYHFIEPREILGRLDAALERTEALLSTATRGRLVREGCLVVIAGAPNVGKSSLFNALVGADRAIMTDVAGTTRDLVSEAVDLGGVRTTFVDTAGLREAADPIEAQGVARARGAARAAAIVIEVVDGTDPETAAAAVCAGTAGAPKRLVVANKADLATFVERPGALAVSALTGHGVEVLQRTLLAMLGASEQVESPALTNIRHIELLERAQASMRRSREAVDEAGGALSEEFILVDLEDARSALAEVSGTRTPDEILRHIFERFCVGK